MNKMILLIDNSFEYRLSSFSFHQLGYRKTLFRVTGFTAIGVLFDGVVCYLGKNLDLYGATESDKRLEFVKEDVAIDNVDKKKEVNGNLNQRTEQNHL